MINTNYFGNATSANTVVLNSNLNNAVASASSNMPMSNEKTKNYRIRNSSWHCEVCQVYCNSQSQFDVHLISQKHKFVLNKGEMTSTSSLITKLDTDENNNSKNELNNNLNKQPDDQKTVFRSRINFSLAEIESNPLARQFQIDAHKYLITEDKKKGKFEKFGFYCNTCDAYMTGQIQLIMHVRGAKHQYFNPGELPGYQNTSSKQFNPHHKKKNKQITPNSLNELEQNYDFSQNAKNNKSGIKHNPYKFYANSIGCQQFYEQFNNNSMHVYTLSHHHQAINKLNNNSNKENLFNENRRFQQQQQQHHQFNNAHMHQIQTKITPRLPDSVNSYNPNIYMPSQAQFNGDHVAFNNNSYASYNLNLVNSRNNSIQIKEEKIHIKQEPQSYFSESSQDSILNESIPTYMNNHQQQQQQQQIAKYEHQYIYSHPTPPPEGHQYTTASNMQYMPKSAMEMQQQQTRSQPIHNGSPPQIIIQNRLGHAIPVVPMLPISASASPISTRSISFYHPQMTNQQIHQNF